MKNRKTITLWLVLISLLFGFGCKLNKKTQTYTTTLEGTSFLVPSPTGGIINKLWVTEGAWISAGDTLAILDSRELRYQVEQIDASLQELTIQTAIANNSLQQSLADFAYVQEKQQRTQRLFDAATIPQQSVDDIGNLMQKSQTQTNNAAKQSEMLKATATKLNAQKKILLKNIADATLISRSSGKVSTLYYHQGEAMAPYANLLELIDTRSLKTKIYVPETLLGSIKTGQQVKLLTASGQIHPASIESISNKAEFTPKTILTPDTRAAMVYAVTIRVDNPQDVLKDGMPVEVEL